MVRRSRRAALFASRRGRLARQDAHDGLVLTFIAPEQVLGQLMALGGISIGLRSAAQVQGTIVHCKKNQGLEEMTVTFASISLAERTGIISRLNALPWVSGASLQVAMGGASLHSAWLSAPRAIF